MTVEGYARDFVGLSGWSTSNRYATAAGEGPAGSASMTAGVVVIPGTVTPAGNQLIFGRGFLPGGRGWAFYSTPTSLVGFQIRDGVGSNAGPFYLLQAGDVGKVLVLMGTYDNTNVRLYRNGVEVTGAPPAGPIPATGYTAPTGADATAIGTDSAGANPATNWTILGGAVASGVATAAEASLWYHLVRRRQSVTGLPSGTVGLWGSNPRVEASWRDRVSGVAATLSGSLSTNLGWTWP